jgi:P-type E1-E2 ATPase
MSLYNECIPEYAVIKMNSKWVNIDPSGVLVGDIVRIMSGQRVPADIRIIEVTYS